MTFLCRLLFAMLIILLIVLIHESEKRDIDKETVARELKKLEDSEDAT